MARELVILGGAGGVDFSPVGVVAEVAQNVRTILSTPVWSVPLDRSFGLNVEMLDRPTPSAIAALTSEIYLALRRWEPRARLKNISFDGDADGRLVPKVRIEVDE